MMILIAFIVGLATDLFWTKCVHNVAEKNALWAANWSIMIHVCGLFATYLLIDKDYIAIVAYIVGGYLGTFLTVKYGSKRNVVSSKDNSFPL